mmetsp:Transcript_52696/g.111958  ORF Transcript_52696/g.111958 Transcript_52696/m.111958 type:complete len:214 (-) Transcript_52696:983-1624(-)
MRTSGESSRTACPAMPAPTTREDDFVQSFRSLSASAPPAREEPPEGSTPSRPGHRCPPDKRATSAVGSSSRDSGASSPCWVSFFSVPSSSLTLPSSPLHLSAVSLLLSVLASAHSCSATTFASSPSTYSPSLLALSTTSIPSAALLFASTALCVTRLISSCISATTASFSLSERKACSVSMRDMRSSSWRLAAAFLADSRSPRAARWTRSRPS